MAAIRDRREPQAVGLPRVEGSAASGPDPLPATPTARPRTGTILLVEDDSGVRRFASRVLEAAGYSVLAAPEGDSALEIARSATIHMLLTDIVMPGLSGSEVAAKLTAAQPSIRVVFMSGHTEQGIVHHGILEAGIRFLAKPFTSEALLSAVDGAMTEVDAG